MAVLRSPFFGENLSLITLRNKIKALDYAPLPSSSFSHEVHHRYPSSEYFLVVFFIASSSYCPMSCDRS